jgi:hypothetical protein
MARVLVLSGGRQPFVDPWHPFAAVSARVAEIAADAGFDVEVSLDPLERLTDLAGVDVLVGDAPNPAMPGSADAVRGEAPTGSALEAASAGLSAFLGRPGGVLGLHVGATGLLGLPQWSPLLGAEWAPGSFHPPLGPAVLQGTDDARVPAAPIEVVDERYTDLRFAPGSRVLVEHQHEGRRHPLVWARGAGPVRVIGDALGHDERSFESPAHRELLVRCLRWLAAG